MFAVAGFEFDKEQAGEFDSGCALGGLEQKTALSDLLSVGGLAHQANRFLLVIVIIQVY